MILFDLRVQELITILPKVNGFTANYYPAEDMDDVNQYLSLKDQPYPLIVSVIEWDNYPFKDAEEVTRKCRFILATAERDVNLLNTQRFDSSYKNVLKPLAEIFLDALETSTISRLHEDFKLKIRPNFSGATKDGQIDIWDAIVLDCTVSINNNCLKPLIKNG